MVALQLSICGVICVTVGSDKPLARLIVVRRLDVDKVQVLRSGILDTLCCFVYYFKELNKGILEKLVTYIP